MVFSKEILLASLKRLAENVKNGGTVGDIDKDYLVVKTVLLVSDGKITEDDAAEVVGVLEPVSEQVTEPQV